MHIEVSYLPSFNLAGDMYYWHKVDDHKYAIILLDMMGHGISASLVCMFISSVLRESVKQLVKPDLVIKELNRYMTLLKNEKEGLPFYFTAIYLVIDTEKKTVEYVNAGHPYGYMLMDEKEVVALEQGTCAVGFFDEMEINTKEVSFEKDIQIILYTDGVLEAMGPCEFEAEKQIQAISSKRWEHTSSVMDHLLTKEQQSDQPDDMCVLMIQAKGSN